MFCIYKSNLINLFMEILSFHFRCFIIETMFVEFIGYGDVSFELLNSSI